MFLQLLGLVLPEFPKGHIIDQFTDPTVHLHVLRDHFFIHNLAHTDPCPFELSVQQEEFTLLFLSYSACQVDEGTVVESFCQIFFNLEEYCTQLDSASDIIFIF